ncbi:tRNA uridine-5-carboxymethylaminomethyl(34) synthesis GTPase MnmE [Allohahella marinimesophila]|uniref:tRNA modification GTPase MnmE n=1 Tax=Allohahella marinimesophila TaxID=1054972 RepID=A0ABP7PC21_9GAMM
MESGGEAPDTIAAIATPPGQGGIGIIRLSGPSARKIGETIITRSLAPRVATLTRFHDVGGSQLDEGIALFFPQPNSFTGEDVFELQGHGGPVVLDLLLASVCKLGARIARPGEFSERAYLNDKLDLVQAEAIADLISASSEQAARSALASLSGDFSATINNFLAELTRVRVYIEAAIDFPEEDVDFLAESEVVSELTTLSTSLANVRSRAAQGRVLRDGISVVLAGKPNAGKSSLLNALAGEERAIVTHVAGTTRDIVREHVIIDGLPLHLLDTAGMRETEDFVERIGVERAQAASVEADALLWIYDAAEQPAAASTPEDLLPPILLQHVLAHPALPLLIVANKADLLASHLIEVRQAQPLQSPSGIRYHRLAVSAVSGTGLPDLKARLKAVAGFQNTGEQLILARRRHIDALERCQQHVDAALNALQSGQLAGELAAEDLRYAQRALSEITGAFSSDDLLGEIFSSFCIGK